MPIFNNANVHYVKFIRGSVVAWQKLLETPEKIDDDTLYFIYESGENTKEGELYLGQKLISGIGGNNLSNINLSDIGDIVIDNELLADKQILTYNETTNEWQNTSLSTIINTAIGEMVGATSITDGTSGLVPVPKIGDQTKFLRGDASWATINIPTFDTNVFNLNLNEISLIGYDLAPVGSVPIKTNEGIQWSTNPIGQLNYEVTTLEKLQAQLNGTDPDPINNNTIYMVLNNYN